jgi:hypothetical protein
MKGEMYVVHMSEMSRKARAVIGEFLGEVDKTRQALELKKIERLQQLTQRLQCPASLVFERLADHVSSIFQDTSMPIFTRDHLKLLRIAKSLESLAKALACPPKDALIHLFDPAVIAITLRGIDPNSSNQWVMDENTFVFALQSSTVIGSLEMMHGAGFNDWGRIIQDEEWLRPEAIDSLKAYAARLHLPANDATRILAAVLTPQRGLGGNATEEGQRFGALAMVWLHQRIMHTVSLLQDESIRLAEEAASYLPTHSAVTNLVPWLEMYERGAVARALPHFIARRKPLGSFLTTKQYSDKLASGQPIPNQTLIVTNQATHTAFVTRKVRGSFTVECHVQGEEAPRTVLDCMAIPVSTYQHLIREVGKLEGSELSPVGKTIGERLLNTRILVPDPFLALITGGIRALGPAFVQCMVLSGASGCIEMNAPWRADLSDELPYAVDAIEKEPHFPCGIREITEKLRLEAGGNVRIIGS